MKAHLEASIEDHLSKTWTELQKTTHVLEEVEDDVEQLEKDNKSLKKSLDKERSDLRKLRAKNETIKKELTKLENQLEEVTRTAAENQKIIKLMKPRVFGTTATSQSKKKRKNPETDYR